MRRLLIALAILLVVLTVGDFVAKAYATTQLRDRAQAAVRGATTSSASISSFPFTGRLLVAGSVQKVQLTGLGSGTVTAELTDVEISRLAGTRVSFRPGQASVDVAGSAVGATVQVTNGTMSFGGARLPFQFRVPRAPLFPCDATSAKVVQGAVELSCTVHNVPAELVGKTLK